MHHTLFVQRLRVLGSMAFFSLVTAPALALFIAVILSHPAVTGELDPERIAAALQLHDEAKQPDAVLPVDALPELVRKVVEEKPERLPDEMPDAARVERALEIYREKEGDAGKGPDAPTSGPKITTQLRNVEREIIKSFED